MEATENKQLSPLKLNVKRTMIIGFAFFGILLLWEVYDKWCAKFLELLIAIALLLHSVANLGYTYSFLSFRWLKTE